MKCKGAVVMELQVERLTVPTVDHLIIEMTIYS